MLSRGRKGKLRLRTWLLLGKTWRPRPGPFFTVGRKVSGCGVRGLYHDFRSRFARSPLRISCSVLNESPKPLEYLFGWVMMGLWTKYCWSKQAGFSELHKVKYVLQRDVTATKTLQTRTCINRDHPMLLPGRLQKATVSDSGFCPPQTRANVDLGIRMNLPVGAQKINHFSLKGEPASSVSSVC